jgi:hypothetical protein
MTTGPVPSQMLTALISTIATTKMMMRTAIFRSVAFMAYRSAVPMKSYDGGCAFPLRRIVPLILPSASTVPLTV